MSRNIVIVLVLVAFGLGAGAGILGFLWATGGNAEPSRDASEVADTLSLDDPTPEPTSVPIDLSAIDAQVNTLAGQLGVTLEQSDNVTVDTLAQKLDTISAAVAGSDASGDGDTSGDSETSTDADTASATVPERSLYRISEDDSEARFKIDEVLSGNPTEVIGTTRRVAGDIIIDFANPQNSQMGTIAINARTLATDNQFRDQAIRSRILQSSQDEFEFITFEPTALEGLPEGPVGVGETVEFQITGNLTIRDVTREVTFDATVTIVSEERIEGSAVALVMYPDFNISIQAPPQVADIGDEVDLEIDFVASRVDE